MKFGHDDSDFDDIDLRILALLQENCKLPLAKIGEKVGLSAPSVIDRIKKLEDNGVIVGYRAIAERPPARQGRHRLHRRVDRSPEAHRARSSAISRSSKMCSSAIMSPASTRCF